MGFAHQRWTLLTDFTDYRHVKNNKALSLMC